MPCLPPVCSLGSLDWSKQWWRITVWAGASLVWYLLFSLPMSYIKRCAVCSDKPCAVMRCAACLVHRCAVLCCPAGVGSPAGGEGFTTAAPSLTAHAAATLLLCLLCRRKLDHVNAEELNVVELTQESDGALGWQSARTSPCCVRLVALHWQ